MQYYYDSIVDISLPDSVPFANRLISSGKDVLLLVNADASYKPEAQLPSSVHCVCHSGISSLHTFGGVVTIELYVHEGLIRLSADTSLSLIDCNAINQNSQATYLASESLPPELELHLSLIDGIEAERRFLIGYPDIERLKSAFPVTVWEIVQTYLARGKSVAENRRIRKIIEHTPNGKRELYLYTEKIALPDASFANIEREAYISKKEYIQLSRCRDPFRCPVAKTRYKFPYFSHTVELDIYPFCNTLAIAEIELLNEEEHPPLPEMLTVISEVTGNKSLSNRSISAPDGYIALCSFMN